MPIGDLTFRPLTRADFPLLARWLATPHVAAWWRESAELEAVAEKYGPGVDGTDPTRLFVIEEDGRPIGFIQCYRHADEPDWDRAVGIPAAAGIDYLIGEPDRIGQGLGGRAIRAFAATVFDRYPEVSVVVAVPQAANGPSRRALERAGFRLVAVRDVESDDPGDAGPSAIYTLARADDNDAHTSGVHRPSAPAHGPIDSSGRPEPDP